MALGARPIVTRVSNNDRMITPLQKLLAPDGPVAVRIREVLSNSLAIYAFGSQLQATATPESDLDLAVLVAGYADALNLWELARQLENISGYPIDLLDLRTASTVMQYQVITTGQRVWADTLQADLFECYVLSEKTALDTARAPLLRDIASTGKIYAR
jgi:predicted nucleotidyltransferase